MFGYKKVSTFFVLISMVILVSCSDTSSKKEPAVIIPTQTNTTIINGITVPPSPDPVINNVTLAGVDSNNNGIRDDVDRLIAITNSDTVQQRKTATRVRAAVKAQIALTATTQNPIDYRKYECEIDTLGPEDGVVFHNAVFNTKERRVMYKNNLPAAGTSYTLKVRPDGLGIQDSECTSDVKPYPSNE